MSQQLRAFPGPQCDDERDGMSLRDYFAAHALQGLCTAQDGSGEWRSHAVEAARFAYEHADAMLAERAKVTP